MALADEERSERTAEPRTRIGQSWKTSIVCERSLMCGNDRSNGDLM